MKKYLAEFIGTFVLVFVACGVAAVTGCSAEGDLLVSAAAGAIAAPMLFASVMP